MSRDQIMNMARAFADTLDSDSNEALLIESLIELASSRRNGGENDILEKVRKTMSFYSMWHRPDEPPRRSKCLLVKNTGDNGKKNYFRADYIDGRFIVNNKEIQIEGWSYMADKFAK